MNLFYSLLWALMLSYEMRNIKSHYRKQRTREQINEMLIAIQDILQGEDGQITIRHLFYRLVGLHIIDKTEKAYQSLGSHLSKWRRSGDISWSAFADNTRWHIQETTFDSV